MLIVKLTQEKMTERLMYLSTLEATVLEVKVIEGKFSPLLSRSSQRLR
jgi:translation initiation factor 5B